MKFDSIIFDLDGTLWDSVEGICETWNEILAKHKEIKREKISREDIEGGMGLLIEEIGKRLFPDQDSKVINELMKECSDLECEYLSIHGGDIYDGLEETLKKLSEKYTLYIVSNCQDGYIEAFLNAHKVGKYFKDYECPGRTGHKKADNIKLIIERNSINNAIYVGDTQGDADAAKEAGVPFVFAKYGFGDVAEYDFVINEIKELYELF